MKNHWHLKSVTFINNLSWAVSIILKKVINPDGVTSRDLFLVYKYVKIRCSKYPLTFKNEVPWSSQGRSSTVRSSVLQPPHSIPLAITPISPHFHSRQLVSYAVVTHFWLEFFSNVFHTSGFNDPSKSMICYLVGTASRTLVSIALGTRRRATLKVMSTSSTCSPIFRPAFIFSNRLKL